MHELESYTLGHNNIFFIGQRSDIFHIDIIRYPFSISLSELWLRANRDLSLGPLLAHRDKTQVNDNKILYIACSVIFAHVE